MQIYCRIRCFIRWDSPHLSTAIHQLMWADKHPQSPEFMILAPLLRLLLHQSTAAKISRRRKTTNLCYLWQMPCSVLSSKYWSRPHRDKVSLTTQWFSLIFTQHLLGNSEFVCSRWGQLRGFVPGCGNPKITEWTGSHKSEDHQYADE